LSAIAAAALRSLFFIISSPEKAEGPQRLSHTGYRVADDAISSGKGEGAGMTVRIKQVSLRRFSPDYNAAQATFLHLEILITAIAVIALQFFL
jgi:hypothetical protein